MLVVRPKFWVVADDPNPDLSEAGWGYWVKLSKVNLDKIQDIIAKNNNQLSTGIKEFLASEQLRMQTYREAVLEAYLKAKRKGYGAFGESSTIKTDLPVITMVTWFDKYDIEPGQFMDITHSGKYAKFIVCTFGEDGLTFPDGPHEDWWPNDYNIPKPHEWKLTIDSQGEATLHTWT